VAVEGSLEVLLREVAHVYPCQPREAAEHEQVADDLVAFPLERRRNHLPDVLAGEEAARADHAEPVR